MNTVDSFKRRSTSGDSLPLPAVCTSVPLGGGTDGAGISAGLVSTKFTGAACTRSDVLAGQYFLRLASRRVRQSLAALTDNDDTMTTAAANAALERF